jgi:hypothetical protein
MPKRIAWRELAHGLDAEDADTVLSEMKSYEITKSNPMACTACSDSQPHQMRYRLLACSSKACASPGVFACPWRGKILTCLKSDEVSIYDFDEHASAAPSPEELPALTTVQNFVNHYSRTHLVNNDRVDDLRDWIHARAFTGEEPIAQPFSFGWDLDSEGKPIVGNGSDEKPFVIGLSTKALIQRLTVPPESFILHVDASSVSG